MERGRHQPADPPLHRDRDHRVPRLTTRERLRPSPRDALAGGCRDDGGGPATELTGVALRFPEPVASVTWSLPAHDDAAGDERPHRLAAVVERGLTSCVVTSGTLLALDRQHTSYRCAPRKAGGPGQPA
ncbi:DUF2716 domain-containing protein [Streptomyces hydrogenans]|uniref:DUF2716 domain-containing protein n=1 Tax=Streptomyces hydrogenans TaxID=1873719 RepID=UPI0035D820DD